MLALVLPIPFLLLQYQLYLSDVVLGRRLLLLVQHYPLPQYAILFLHWAHQRILFFQLLELLTLLCSLNHLISRRLELLLKLLCLFSLLFKGPHFPHLFLLVGALDGLHLPTLTAIYPFIFLTSWCIRRLSSAIAACSSMEMLISLTILYFLNGTLPVWF